MSRRREKQGLAAPNPGQKMPTSALFANAPDWKQPTPHVRGRDGWVPATRRVTTEPHGGTCYCCTTWVDPRVAAPRGGAGVLVGGSVWRTRAKVTGVGTWSDQDGQQKGWGDLRAAGSSCGAPGVDGAVLCGGLSSPPSSEQTPLTTHTPMGARSRPYSCQLSANQTGSSERAAL